MWPLLDSQIRAIATDLILWETNTNDISGKPTITFIKHDDSGYKDITEPRYVMENREFWNKLSYSKPSQLDPVSKVMKMRIRI